MYCAGKEGEYNGRKVMGILLTNGVFCVEVKIPNADSCDLISAIHAQVAKDHSDISGVASLLSTAT
jgi:hypothetical protein